MITTAIILAGGFGTRLKQVLNNVPKPMAPINDFPFLHYQFLYLKHYGFKQVILSTGHLANVIENYFKNEYLGIKVLYAHEENPLGTGGGIKHAFSKSESKECIVLNGDSYFNINLTKFYKNYLDAKAQSKAQFALALRKVDNAGRYGTITTFKNIITTFKEKTGTTAEGIINGGVYILNKSTFFNLSEGLTNFSIEKDIFESHFNTINIAGFINDGYFIDIGIPEDYLKAQYDFKRFEY